MAKSLKAQVTLARAKLDKQIDAVFATASDNTTPFQTCLLHAPLTVADAYRAARRLVDDLESTAVATCKAYRSSFNMLSWYR